MTSDLFGPIEAKYCAYYYYVSVASFVLMILTLIGCISSCLFGKKKNTAMIVNTLTISLSYFFIYLSSRILNTICVKVL
jgi:hypothetical protein